MECLIQYLDEVEDIFYAIALVAERIRQAIKTLLLLAVSTMCPAWAVLLAIAHPPMALATAFLALSGLLYHAVVGSPPILSPDLTPDLAPETRTRLVVS
jgi:hypothetical protein